MHCLLLRNRLVLMACATFGLVACYSARPAANAGHPRPSADLVAPVPTNARVRSAVPRGERFVAGWSPELRAIHYEVHGDGDETVILIGGIHGDEPAGGPLLDRLADHLRANPRLLEGRRVVILPRANPDGLARGTRFNSHGVDLNRNFPASNFRASKRSGPIPLSEPESRVLRQVLETFRPARVLSLHQPLACVDWDGDGIDLAYMMARHSRLPVRKLGGRPGSLGSWVSRDLAAPIITFELPKNATRFDLPTLWRRYGNAVLAFVLYPEPPSESPASRLSR
jgi:protein MpaA